MTPPWIAQVTLIFGGVLLLLLGAEGIVRGGVAIARRMRLSPLWIGLTVVAVGTSAPEIAVGVEAALAGKGAVALGNVVGSNILNVLLVLGAISLVHPIAVSAVVRNQDLPLVLVASLGVWALAANGTIGRIEGLLLTCAAVAYLYWVYHRERGQPVHDAVETPLASKPWPLAAAIVLGGFIALSLGGQAVLTGSLDLARSAGISERVIAITIVALGTSLPELAVGVAGAWKREVHMVLGNVVGSNLLNLGLVLGPAALVKPLQFSEGIHIDFATMTAAALLLGFVALVFQRVGRRAGAGFLLLYLSYTAYLLISAGR